MKFISLSNRTTLRENAPQGLAYATFILAGYGAADILATVSKAVI